MISSILHFATSVLLPLGVLGVFLAAFLEEVIAPVPSPVIIMLAGITFLSDTSGLELIYKLLFYIVLPTSLGIVIGSLVIYYLAYYLGKPFVKTWGKWLFISWDDIEKIEKKYRKDRLDSGLIFILRSIPVVPSVAIATFAGLTRIPVRVYVIYSFLGTLIRTTILGLIGWKAGEIYLYYAKQIDKYEKWIFLLLIIFVIVFIFYRIYKKKKQNVV